MENSTNNQIVTSFRANGNNWKKLKVLATVDGVPVQDKLNQVIEEHLEQHYNKSLGIERRTDESSGKE